VSLQHLRALIVKPKPVGNNAPIECIDQTVFDQILELDDEDDKSFSKGMVDAYYEQAEKTFESMDDALCALTPFLSPHTCSSGGLG
jgi:hypothetical protein